MTIIMICNFVLLAVQCGVVEKLPFWEVIFYSSRENTTGLNPFLKENLHFYTSRVHESGWDNTPLSSVICSVFFHSILAKGGALFWINWKSPYSKVIWVGYLTSISLNTFICLVETNQCFSDCSRQKFLDNPKEISKALC